MCALLCLYQIWLSSDFGNTWTLVGGVQPTASTSYLPGGGGVSSAAASTTPPVYGSPTACADNVNGILYLISPGTTNGVSNTVYTSTDGQVWVSSTGAFVPRSAPQCAVDGNGGVYVLAGKNSAGVPLNDVWYSPTYGTTGSWRQQSASAPWLGRDSPAATTSYSATLGKTLLYMATGYYYQAGTNEVSSDNGQSSNEVSYTQRT